MRSKTALIVGAAGVVATVAFLIGRYGSPNSSSPSPSPSQTPVAPTPQPATPQSIQAFVTAIYAEAVPYDGARSFGVAAVPELLTLLNDPSMADARSNIVVTLGMIGGDTAENELKKLVEQGSGKLAEQEFSVRLDALMSLGYAAKVASNVVTETYLTSGLESAFWDSKVLWQRPDGGNPFSSLRERTIIALGLSGTPRAKIVLENLLASGGAGGGRGGGGGGSHQLTPSDRAVISEAIRANEYLATHSLSQYFKEYK